MLTLFNSIEASTFQAKCKSRLKVLKSLMKNTILVHTNTHSVDQTHTISATRHVARIYLKMIQFVWILSAPEIEAATLKINK